MSNQQYIVKLAQEIIDNAENGYDPEMVNGMADLIRFLAWDDQGFPPFGVDNEKGLTPLDNEKANTVN